MKLRIFLLTVGTPLALALAFLWPPMDRLSIRLALLIAITTGLLISLFFNRKKYLRRLELHAGKVSLEYISAPLVTRNLHFDLQEVEDLRLLPDGFRYEAAGALQIKSRGAWQRYIILDKKTYAAVQQAIELAGLNAGKARVQPA